MADPNWSWLDWRAWLWAACGLLGLLLALPFYLLGQLMSLFGKGKR